VAMEYPPFMINECVPIETSIYRGFSIAMFDDTGGCHQKKTTFTSPDIFHGGVHSPSLFWKSVSLLEDRRTHAMQASLKPV